MKGIKRYANKENEKAMSEQLPKLTVVIDGPLAKMVIGLTDYMNQLTPRNQKLATPEETVELFILKESQTAYENLYPKIAGDNDAKALFDSLTEWRNEYIAGNPTNPYVDVEATRAANEAVKSKLVPMTPEIRAEVDTEVQARFEHVKKLGLSREQATAMLDETIKVTDLLHDGICKLPADDCPYRYGMSKLRSLFETLPSHVITGEEIERAIAQTA